MATTTPNFGWPVPTSTDLVKDGATAIEGLGDAIDASLLDLKGGTTGQVLAKASGTDMDFSWVAQDDSNAIQNAIVDAKGDIIAATANDTPARLAVGANNTVLTADSSTATGLKWASPASSAQSFTLISNTSLTSFGASTCTISSLSGYNQFYVNFDAVSMTSAAGSAYLLRINTDTGARYSQAGVQFLQPTSISNAYIVNFDTATSFQMGHGNVSSAAGQYFAHLQISGANAAGVKPLILTSSADASGYPAITTGVYTGTSVISSISIIGSSNFDAGNIRVYGAN
jgi:hypothetical protein